MKKPILLLLATAAAAILPEAKVCAQEAPCHHKILRYKTWQQTPATAWNLSIDTPTGGKLRYLGAEHSTDTSHSQFQIIKENWEALHPTIAFFEGPDRGIAATEQETISQLGESGYVRYLAKASGIKTRSLEPGPQEEVDYLLSLEKFTPEQVKLFFILREASRLRERKGMNEEEIKEAIAQLLPKADQLIPALAGVLPDTASLQPAFEKYWARQGEWWQAPAHWFDPLKDGKETGGNFTNEINTHSSDFRNLHMYRILTEAVQQGERVLAVVGRNHVPMQAEAIRCELE
ncbi:TraB/GumN family protein [Pontibacter mangrovi]|uniref:TraB/GumN family protein n=1 Tax=Pontibacter mangrovi TaxID=2589816 RepID=A0A501W6G3_9BACT|nr:hypothetical protein [Pontibacter mangrovi]TPE42881.1 hypothetical protein FJM65_16275 [Pontibacter mangrovi]